MAKIAIDIGHGTNTKGKGVTRNGKSYREHDFNSKVAIRLKELLEQQGFTVVYGPQKPNSRDIGLTTRTNWYNRNKVDLVVSIHANANSNSNVNGRCAFYWHTSSKGKSLASRIIKEIKAKGYSTHGNGLHASKRGSWTNLHITRATNMPAVLIEHGFMTGNKDFQLIFGNKQAKYVEDMAQADAKAITEYFGKSYKSSAPKKKDDELYRVQTGAFSKKENAKKLAKELKDKGYSTFVTEESKKTNNKPAESYPKSVSGATLAKVENAYFKANTPIKVRTVPSTKAKHTGTLPKDASINYFAVYQGNGYRWLRYNTKNGARYLPYRPLKGNTKSWGSFHSKRP